MRSGNNEIIREMTGVISHRGPDGEGFYLGEGIALGHRRLKIIDLSDNAKQPMSDASVSVVVSFNGEIYNFRELKPYLEKKYPFKSTSDTEVIVYGYKEWGTDIFRRLNGMFAIALWDKTSQTLILARDRLGKKPLFYFWDGTQCIFGSELKALLQHPAITKEIDTQSLVQYFAFGYVPTPRSIFRHVFKVPPGSFISFCGRTKNEANFWELPGNEMLISEEDALEQLDQLLQDAVKIRLESDVPLGFFLSGGIDSSLIAAIGKKIAGDIHTFSIGFRNPEYDETPYARSIAQYLGTRHTELYLDETHFSSFMGEATSFFDEPFADNSLLPTHLLSKITREYVTVALSGDGGDELFCGYTKYLNLKQALSIMLIPSGIRSIAAQVLQGLPTNKAKKMGQAIKSESTGQLLRWLVTLWKPHELKQLMPEVSLDWEQTLFEQTLARFQQRDVFSRLMAADIKTYLCDDILQKVDRASMAVALEMRAPLLDHRIVEFAVRLPLILKYQKGIQKYLLKKLLERYIPEPLWMRKKHGFNTPLEEWYRGSRRIQIEFMIKELAEGYPSLLSYETMQHIVQQHVSGKIDCSQKIFCLEMLHLWSKKYL